MTRKLPSAGSFIGFFKKYPPSCPFYGNFLTYSAVI